MKSIHIRDVDPIVMGKISQLARLHHRSVQGELKSILAEAARRAEVLDQAPDEGLVVVSVPVHGTYRREDIYDDSAR